MSRNRRPSPHAGAQPRPAPPPRKASSATAGPASRRPWGIWLGIGLLLSACFAAWWTWRVTAPPPVVVNTAGYDPVIAAAIAQSRDAALRSPRSAEARGRMGMVLLAHSVRAEAAACFTQASAFAPQDPRWHYFLGLAQLVDNPMGAVTNLEQAVRLFPENESAPRLRLADTLLGLGRLDEAEALFRHVKQREPNSAPVALGLGKVMNARDRLPEAATFLAAATDDPSTRRSASRLLVNVNQRLGQTNQAEQLARVLAELPNDTPLADPLFDQVEQLKTGEQAWVDLAEEWIKTGRVADAAKLLEKSVQTYPKSARAKFLLGRARQRLGDVIGAEAILVQAIELAPDSVEALMQLGVLRLGQGRARDAQRCFRAAIQAKPNLGQAWLNLGLSLGGEADRSECIAAFREAIRLKPNLIEAYLGLAVILRASGENQAAAVELRRALDLDPEESLRKKLLDQLKLTGQP